MPTHYLAKFLPAFGPIALVFALTTTQAQEPVGERWNTVRGDNSPGLSYSTFVETPSGRWLAAGRGGQLMLSDNNGADWRYQVITNAVGEALFANITDMVVIESTIVATAVSIAVTDRDSGLPPGIGRTQLLSSNNNGDTWNIQDFPERDAQFLGTIPVPGVYLPNLYVAPNGQLLAYGSALQVSGGQGYYIGGLIFRRQGPTWEQVYFEQGVLQSINEADNGRLVAGGFQTILDSADGAGWNGYAFVDANMNVDGQPLDFDQKELLNVSDAAFINNNYVIQTQRFRRSDEPNVFEIAGDKPTVFQSPNPFDGGRIWNGTEASQIYPNWINTPAGLTSVYRGAFTSSDGVNWEDRDDTVTPRALSVGQAGAQSVVAVGNSDEVWLSSNNGETWSKILDNEPGFDLQLFARVGNTLLALGLARVEGAFTELIFRSVDNGNTWVPAADVDGVFFQTLTPTIGKVDGDRFFAATGLADQLIASDDGGVTVRSIALPDAGPFAELQDVVIGQSGRLVIAPQNKRARPEDAVFYVSDDHGASWSPRSFPMDFNATPKRGLHLGGGRIIYLLNLSPGGRSSFQPELIISDDNGNSWRRENPFQSIEGMDLTNTGQNAIELTEIFQTAQGTLIIIGDSNELLYSEDQGASFELGFNLSNGNIQQIRGIVESQGRLFVPGYTRIGGSFSQPEVENFVLISEDEGKTWRQVPVPSDLLRTRLTGATVGADGRVILSGTNGAIFVSDALTAAPDLISTFSVREGESITLAVPRPPAEGDISVTWSLLPFSADAGDDFIQTMGQLSWLADDPAPQAITVDTVDDALVEEPENLQVMFSVAGDLKTSFSYDVTITDNEESQDAGIEVLANTLIQTSEEGASDQFRVVLSRAPSADVDLSLALDLSGEITAQPGNLMFTPTNWSTPQTVTATGIDDADRDFNRAVTISLTPASSDENYQALDPVLVFVLNTDNEVDVGIFQDGFE